MIAAPRVTTTSHAAVHSSARPPRTSDHVLHRRTLANGLSNFLPTDDPQVHLSGDRRPGSGPMFDPTLCVLLKDNLVLV